VRGWQNDNKAERRTGDKFGGARLPHVSDLIQSDGRLPPQFILGRRTAEPQVHRVYRLTDVMLGLMGTPWRAVHSEGTRDRPAAGRFLGLTLNCGGTCFASLVSSGYLQEPRPTKFAADSPLLAPRF
jgi:hypothetical protein